MSKPTVVPTWATDVSAFKSDPGNPKRALGWLAGEKPAADWWNQIMNEVGLWLTWLNGLQAEALTWTGIQTFSLASVFTAGFSAVAQAIFKAGLRVETSATANTRVLVFEFTIPAATGQKVRIYVNTDASFIKLEITINAAWSGTQWVPDATDECFVYEFGKYRVLFKSKAGTAAVAFNDNTMTAWANIAMAAAGGAVFSSLLQNQSVFAPPDDFQKDDGTGGAISRARASSTFPGYALALSGVQIGMSARIHVPVGASLQNLALFFHQSAGTTDAVLDRVVLTIYTKASSPTSISNAYTKLVCVNFSGSTHISPGQAGWFDAATYFGPFTSQTVPLDSFVEVSFRITAGDADLSFGGARLGYHGPIAPLL